jgi:hypothetical protein
LLTASLERSTTDARYLHSRAESFTWLDAFHRFAGEL